MKFTKLLVAMVVLFVTLAGTLSATAGERKVLYFNPKLIAGVGGTIDRGPGDNGTFHLGAGGMLFSLDRNGLVGLLGLGYGVDFYDFQHHDGALRDLARDSSGAGLLGGGAATGFLAIIPVRVGPFVYEFTWSNHVRSFGRDRGRLHLIKLDIIGFIRLYRSS